MRKKRISEQETLLYLHLFLVLSVFMFSEIHARFCLWANSESVVNYGSSVTHVIFACIMSWVICYSFIFIADNMQCLEVSYVYTSKLLFRNYVYYLCLMRMYINKSKCIVKRKFLFINLCTTKLKYSARRYSIQKQLNRMECEILRRIFCNCPDSSLD